MFDNNKTMFIQNMYRFLFTINNFIKFNLYIKKFVNFESSLEINLILTLIAI